VVGRGRSSRFLKSSRFKVGRGSRFEEVQGSRLKEVSGLFQMVSGLFQGVGRRRVQGLKRFKVY